MKKFLLMFSFSLSFSFSFSQGVGIGTSNPNSSALLDLTSTSKGFLPPRMTTSQMFAIPDPVPGLIVFNSTYNELYQFNGITWRSILNSNYWMRPIANRQMIGNADDSVGIGLIMPTQRLDVNGNARFRNNVTVGTTLSANTLISNSNLVAGGDGTVVGTLLTHSALVVNNSSAIVQMQSAGENKGYMQLSGDNMRIGTNVGNTSGNLIFRLNGNENVAIEPGGTMNMTGNIKRPSSAGDHGLLPIAYGKVNREGLLITSSSTDNVSASRISEGEYRITLNEKVPNAIIIVTPVYEYYEIDGAAYVSGNAFMYTRVTGYNSNPPSTQIYVYAVGITLGGGMARWDNSFSFIIYGNPE